MITQPTTSIRNTAKAIIRTGAGEIVFVKGQQGRWNLPGGGLRPNETATDALHRELDEEIYGLTNNITPLESFMVLRGITSCASGRAQATRWNVFTTTLRSDPAELVIADPAEIQEIATFSPSACHREQHISQLALRAVRLDDALRAVTA